MPNIGLISLATFVADRRVAVFVQLGLTLAMPVHAEEGVHVVRAGDTLSNIAQSYGVSASELAASNGVSNQNVIFTGQRLVIPGSAADQRTTIVADTTLPAGDGYYTVQRGDMLTSVAKANGMTLTDVMRLNGLTDPNFIWVGQKLRVSARVSLTEAPDAKPEVADTIYVVQVGDSLSQIAKDHNTTTYVLMAANGLPNANFVWVGPAVAHPGRQRWGWFQPRRGPGGRLSLDRGQPEQPDPDRLAGGCGRAVHEHQQRSGGHAHSHRAV